MHTCRNMYVCIYIYILNIIRVKCVLIDCSDAVHDLRHFKNRICAESAKTSTTGRTFG